MNVIRKSSGVCSQCKVNRVGRRSAHFNLFILKYSLKRRKGKIECLIYATMSVSIFGSICLQRVYGQGFSTTGNMLTCSPPNYMVLNVGDVLHQLNANWLTSRLEPGRGKQWSSPGMGEEKKIPKHPRLKKKKKNGAWEEHTGFFFNSIKIMTCFTPSEVLLCHLWSVTQQ